MTAAQFRAAIARLGVTSQPPVGNRRDYFQKGFSRFLKADPKTVRRWAAGTTTVPEAITLLVSLMLKFGVTPEQAWEIANEIVPNLKDAEDITADENQT